MAIYAFIQISVDASKQYSPIDEHESELYTNVGELADDIDRAVREVVENKHPQFEIARVELT